MVCICLPTHTSHVPKEHRRASRRNYLSQYHSRLHATLFSHSARYFHRNEGFYIIRQQSVAFYSELDCQSTRINSCHEWCSHWSLRAVLNVVIAVWSNIKPPTYSQTVDFVWLCLGLCFQLSGIDLLTTMCHKVIITNHFRTRAKKTRNVTLSYAVKSISISWRTDIPTANAVLKYSAPRYTVKSHQHKFQQNSW